MRESQARETRDRIAASARELFLTSGFSETTITAIAKAAGVAPQTVYSTFGSKGGIVVALLDGLEEDADGAERIRDVINEPDPYRQLRLFVAWIRRLFERGAPVIRAAMDAISDPDVRTFSETGDERRRRGAEALTRKWSAAQVLRDGLDQHDAAERLWLLTSAEAYLQAVDRLEWSPDRYERWLGDLLERELLSDRQGDVPAR